MNPWGLTTALETLARHEQMEQREFAGCFLVGTLPSLLVAMAVAAVLRQLLGA